MFFLTPHLQIYLFCCPPFTPPPFFNFCIQAGRQKILESGVLEKYKSVQICIFGDLLQFVTTYFLHITHIAVLCLLHWFELFSQYIIIIPFLSVSEKQPHIMLWKIVLPTMPLIMPPYLLQRDNTASTMNRYFFLFLTMNRHHLILLYIVRYIMWDILFLFFMSINL